MRVKDRLQARPPSWLMTLQHLGGSGLLLQPRIVRGQLTLSRRVFSMAMTAWSAKVADQLNLLVGERAVPLGGR